MENLPGDRKGKANAEIPIVVLVADTLVLTARAQLLELRVHYDTAYVINRLDHVQRVLFSVTAYEGPLFPVQLY